MIVARLLSLSSHSTFLVLVWEVRPALSWLFRSVNKSKIEVRRVIAQNKLTKEKIDPRETYLMRFGMEFFNERNLLVSYKFWVVKLNV